MSNQILSPQFPVGSPHTCFISYSHDDEAHKKWVLDLADNLSKFGILVYIDAWDLEPGDDVGEYMEEKVRASQYVIVVCTPEYKQKANSRERGVGSETRLIGSEFFKKIDRPNKFVPVLAKGSKEESMPDYMGDAYYIDFTSPEIYSNSLEFLMRHIYNIRKHARPPLGKPPWYIAPIQLDSGSTEQDFITIESEVKYKLGEQIMVLSGGSSTSWNVIDVSAAVPEYSTGLFVQVNTPPPKGGGFV